MLLRNDLGESNVRQLKKVYLEITNQCNLDCSFCPKTRRQKGFLTPEEFHTLAEKIRPHSEYLYLHLMGEPLLHPNLPEILDIASELKFKVMITTNGTLLPRREELICSCPAVHKISVSLHSFEGNDCHGTTMEDYLDGCLNFAAHAAAAGKRCGLRLWNLDGAETQGANSQNGKILARMEQHFPKPWKEGWQGAEIAPRVYLEWGEKFEWPDLEDGKEENTRGFCYGLRDHVGVLCDGTVVPCCLDHEGDIPLGNLFDQSLEEIMDSPRARAIYEGFSGRKVTEELCRTCGYMRRF